MATSNGSPLEVSLPRTYKNELATKLLPLKNLNDDGGTHAYGHTATATDARKHRHD